MDKEYRVNEEIRARRVRLIARDGKQLGVVPLEEALHQAEMAELDLVEVAPRANPPVCRIMDYDKHRYEISKKGREARKKQKSQELKEIWIRPQTEIHDYQVKAKHIAEFLKKGNKVKVTVRFRGRELAHADHGWKILERLMLDLGECGNVESKPKAEGRNLVMIFSPKRREVNIAKA